jgi:hypothetical protein
MSIQRVLKDAIRKLKPTKKESEDVQHQVKNIIDELTIGLNQKLLFRYRSSCRRVNR